MLSSFPRQLSFPDNTPDVLKTCLLAVCIMLVLSGGVQIGDRRAGGLEQSLDLFMEVGIQYEH